MSKELQFPGSDRDPRIAAALDTVLVPPSDDAQYWSGLQQRIMARVATAAPTTWWAVTPTMARAGMLAAALALLVLGALAMQNRELETRMAFQAVTETELEVARIIPEIDEPYAQRARSADAPTSAR